MRVWMVVCLPRDKQSVSHLHPKTAGSHDLKCRGSGDKKNSMDTYLTAFCTYLPKCMISI